MKVGRKAQGIPTHLFIADDALFFFKANEGGSCGIVWDILDRLCGLLGEMVSFDKSSLVLSNTKSSTKQIVEQIVQVKDKLSVNSLAPSLLPWLPYGYRWSLHG